MSEQIHDLQKTIDSQYPPSTNTETTYYVGIDVGSSTTKVAVIDQKGQLLGRCTVWSRHNVEEAYQEALAVSLEQAGIERSQVHSIMATGYGRNQVSIANERMTELSCHAQGCHYYFPEPVVVVDIGGQDSKVMRLAANGKRLKHRMNRKCAAGTGSFLEDIARRLHIPLESLDHLASSASAPAKISSYCTVFAGTELIERVRKGEPLAPIVLGMFRSLVERVVEMDPLDGKIVCTGGVISHNPTILRLLCDMSHGNVVMAPHPQEMGAFGAALLLIKHLQYQENACTIQSDLDGNVNLDRNM